MSPSRTINRTINRINRLAVTAVAIALQLTLWLGCTTVREKPPAVVQLSPTDINGWLRKGLELNAAGRYQEALDAFQQAVAIDPANAFAWFNLGTSAALLGRYHEAAGYLTEAVKITPDLLPAWSNLGALYNHLERPADSLAAFRQVLRLQPGNADAHYQAALDLIALGRTGEAHNEYELLRSLDPLLAEKLLPALQERRK